ncbi:uncharacterized protein LY89DRAFT_111202 [Mollisia scopiformis]|uniref:Transmembrane protein n=1 Tax=Mollisia scopiformis TaxID=149040 RepID=A0A194X5C5_MOLSC|nr:uncharacterized protein LY89DRAFT_111202 [Mollisia scopiformis]KUJ15371.1 hypothetical protein LY89DRAFT_111202 [Mollisia scopiformis]
MHLSSCGIWVRVRGRGVHRKGIIHACCRTYVEDETTKFECDGTSRKPEGRRSQTRAKQQSRGRRSELRVLFSRRRRAKVGVERSEVVGLMRKSRGSSFLVVVVVMVLLLLGWKGRGEFFCSLSRSRTPLSSQSQSKDLFLPGIA